jgi:cell division protein ZapA
MSPNIKVNIFNQTYSIGSELGEAYIRELAEYVDGKMRTIADASSTVDTQKVATFAAMAIADELYTMRKDRGEQQELMKEQAERCLTLVERALKQTE